MIKWNLFFSFRFHSQLKWHRCIGCVSNIILPFQLEEKFIVFAAFFFFSTQHSKYITRKSEKKKETNGMAEITEHRNNNEQEFMCFHLFRPCSIYNNAHFHLFNFHTAQHSTVCLTRFDLYFFFLFLVPTAPRSKFTWSDKQKRTEYSGFKIFY